MIELGETLADAVRREVREECSIEVEPGQVIRVVDRIFPDQAGHIHYHYVVIYLLARYVSGEARPGSDAAALTWATRQELNSLHMVPVARQVVEHAFDLAQQR